MKGSRGEERARVVEGWIGEFGRIVWVLTFLCSGKSSLLPTLFEQTFVDAFRTYDRMGRYPTVRAALVDSALRTCLSLTWDDVPPSEPRLVADVEEALQGQDWDAAQALSPAAVAALAPTQKRVLLTFLALDQDTEATMATILRTRAYVQRTIREATDAVLGARLVPETMVERLNKLAEELRARIDAVVLPESLATRTVQMVQAARARQAAMRTYEGPRWFVYGVGALAVLAVSSVAYAVVRPRVATPAASAAGTAQTVPELPKPLGNFPGTVVAQYRLAYDVSTIDLSHLAVDHNAVYTATLANPAGSGSTITVRRCPFSLAGRDFYANSAPVGVISVMPPAVDEAGAPRTSRWQLNHWDFSVSGPWAIAVADWESVGQPAMQTAQIYTLYVPTGQSNLVKTVTARTAAGGVAVAAGDGKIVVQAAVDTGKAAGLARPVSLPIDVYTLPVDATQPDLGEPKRIPASFGLMMNPCITGDTLVFQGIQGQPDVDVPNSTWYALSWDGQLSRYVGPPIDGQRHWAVKGTTGTLWWLETTPDNSHPPFMQVLMSPLTDPAAEQPAAQSLAGPVRLFTAQGEYVAWVQVTDDVTQLVVGTMS